MSVLALIAAAAAAPAAQPAPPAPNQTYELVWADEFDGRRIDPARWTLVADCWGGGNDERQCYTDSRRNARVKNGALTITARRETARGASLPEALRTAADPGTIVTRDFTSAKLVTKGKAAWRHGRIEVRAKLPQGQGAWPAIWMLPAQDRYGRWAASGEIDILEAVNLGVPCAGCPGGRDSTILGTLHFGGVWPDNKFKGEEFAYPPALDGGWHVFAVDWQPGRIDWSVDGTAYATRVASEWSTTGSTDPEAPFDQPFYLILNLAIGGKLAETRGLGGIAADGYPRRMAVDWVRVWQMPPASAPQDAADGG